MKKNKYTILHLPTSVGGNPWGLSQGERSLGLESSVLYRKSNWLNYPYHINLHLENHKNYIKFIKLISAFFKLRNQYDIFHFNFGSSLIHAPEYGLYHLELPFYPKNKKLFVTYNGCDSRQKYPTMQRRKISACHQSDCYDGICNSGKMDRMRQKSIRKMTKHVKHIWAVNPDLLYFLPEDKSSFLPYSVIVENKRYLPYFSNKKLNIVHAPTNQAAKGSSYILQALEDIQKTHSNEVDIQIIEGIPHAQATKMYQQADLIIDQLLVGWYGGFAIEVMNMRKPVICRIEKDDLHWLPKEMAVDVLEAFIQAEPNNIKEVILRCIADRQFLKEKSEAAIEYANKWHHPEYVASITKANYEEYL